MRYCCIVWINAVNNGSLCYSRKKHNNNDFFAGFRIVIVSGHWDAWMCWVTISLMSIIVSVVLFQNFMPNLEDVQTKSVSVNILTVNQSHICWSCPKRCLNGFYLHRRDCNLHDQGVDRLSYSLYFDIISSQHASNYFSYKLRNIATKTITQAS